MRIIYLLFTFIFLFSCFDSSSSSNKEDLIPQLPNEEFDYLNHQSYNAKRHASNLRTNLQVNEVKNEIATLGRVLFYDKKLSVNNRVSCGSCHNQQQGFSDGEKVSAGFNNELTPRNSMSISNLLFANKFFWDSRQTDLNSQVIEPIQNHVEMGLTDMRYLEEKLASVDYYPDLFYKAYGSYEITEEKVAKSLTQFIQTMLSHSSPFDKGELTVSQLLGEELFMENCQTCHREPSNTGSWSIGGSANIGLDLTYEDNGVGALFGTSARNGRFKIPSLRNIAVTAPYMHDGRFATLKEVVEHYNSGIKNHENLDWRLQDLNGPKRMHMTEIDMNALVDFMESFTDLDFLQDERFADPFVK